VASKASIRRNRLDIFTPANSAATASKKKGRRN